MAKLIIFVEIPDAIPTHEDPHEAAADILYHYEAHRETNQTEREVRFVDSNWAETLLARRIEFIENELNDDHEQSGGRG